MANLSVRKLDVVVYKRLKMRAQQHHVSVEEEVRQIISQAVSAPQQLSRLFNQYFGKCHGIDLDHQSSSSPHEPIDFNS